MHLRIPQWLPLSLITVSTVTGLLCLADYSNRPGGGCGEVILNLAEAGTLPIAPSNGSGGGGTLLFFYHPRCPCTAASLHELGRIVKGKSREIQAVGIAFCPQDENSSWTDSSTTKTATRLLDSEVVVDFGARTIREFGIKTSGHVLYYDAAGTLLFSGGITPGRGHEGESPAGQDLREKIAGRDSSYRQWPVFGCELYSFEMELP